MKFTVIIADTWRTYFALTNEYEHVPYRKRAVVIELTPEQVAAIGLREVGQDGKRVVFEEVHEIHELVEPKP